MKIRWPLVALCACLSVYVLCVDWRQWSQRWNSTNLSVTWKGFGPECSSAHICARRIVGIQHLWHRCAVVCGSALGIRIFYYFFISNPIRTFHVFRIILNGHLVNLANRCVASQFPSIESYFPSFGFCISVSRNAFNGISEVSDWKCAAQKVSSVMHSNWL